MMPFQETPPIDVTLKALATVCQSEILDDKASESLVDANISWKTVWELAEAENITSWCLDFVARHPKTIDSDRLASWRQTYFTGIARTHAALRQLSELTSACADAGIRLIALKGAALLLWLYEDPGIRGLSDIDLLVREEDALKAVSVLKKMGYATMAAHQRFSNPEVWFHLCRMDGGHFPPFLRGNDYPIELHVGFLRKRGNWLKSEEEVWKNAVMIDCGGVLVGCLPPEQAFLHAAIHYGHHKADGETQLSMLLDAAVIVSRKNLLDWTALWEMAQRWQVTYDLRAMLIDLEDSFTIDTPIPSDIIDSREPMEGESPFRRFLGMPTLGLKLSYLSGSIIPPPAYMQEVFGQGGSRPLWKAYGYMYSLRFRDTLRRVKRSLRS